MMTPVVEELAARLAGTVKVAKLNVDQNPQTAERLGIRSIPTLLLFRNGQAIQEMIGAASLPKIEAAIRGRLQAG
jgi:thioredoxin-like negative regulator of GroEL